MKERNHLRDLGVDGRIILKWMLNKLRERGIACFSLFSVEIGAGLLYTRQ